MAILVLGGARSGKSRFAESLAHNTGKELVYLATAQAGDEEMRVRIKHHRQQRGYGWQTIEEPLALKDTLLRECSENRVILVDCLTLWLTNLMLAEADIDQEIDALAACISGLNGPVILVSNEVGQGIVPIDAMARAFRDHAGRLHQHLAATCNDVWFVTAGIPQQLKGTKR